MDNTREKLIELDALIDNIDWDNDLQKWTLIGEPEDIPTVDALEVVHGRWIPVIDRPTPFWNCETLSAYKCSICGRYEDQEEPYCNCGAKMDGDGNVDV